MLDADNQVTGLIFDYHLVARGASYDHEFGLRLPGLPRESDPGAFLDANANPWAILVGSSWRYPLEGMTIDRAYPRFGSWRDSGGRVDRDWLEWPDLAVQRVADPIESLIPRRSWTLRGPEDRF